MYYRLKEPYAFCGWKKKPHAIWEEHLGDITQKGFYYDVVKTTVSDLLGQNPECASCEYLPKCCGGCMVDSISEEGNYLIPHQAICHFFKNIGEDAVRAVADKAIEQYCKSET
jgi:radical SAM protein with 4Fe4S-binding SPASM domain